MCTHSSSIAFRKATASGNNQSGPNCVEVGAFFKATRSGAAGHCVEVAFTKAQRSNPNGNCVEVAYAKAQQSGAAGHCVEVAHAKPSASVPNGACVEPGQATAHEHTDCTPETCLTPGIEPGDIVVRDSKLGEDSPLAVFKHAEWELLVAATAAGQTCAWTATSAHGATITDPRNGVVLSYTVPEWEAFTDGCRKDEFAYAPLTSVPA